MTSGQPAAADPPQPRSLAQRLGAAAGVLLLLLVPVGVAAVLGGPDATRGAALGAVFGLLAALRSGWRRALVLVPFLVAGVAAGTLLAGSGWWVVLLGAIGVAAGLATSVGALATVALVGMVTATTLGSDGQEAALPAVVLAAAGAGLYLALVAARLGLPAVVPEPVVSPRRAAAVAVVLGGIVTIAALVARQVDGAFAYWLPMTVFLLAIPTPGLALSTAARSRVLGTAAGVSAGLVLAALDPAPAARGALAVVLLLSVLTVVEPLWLNAALSTVLIVVLLDPAGQGLSAGGARLLATVEAALLVLAGLGLLLVLDRWPAARRAEHGVLASAAEPQTAGQGSG